MLLGCGSVFLRRRCDTLYISSFVVDDVMFSYHGASGPDSSTTLRLEEVRQLDVKRTTVFGRVRLRQTAATGAKSAVYD